MPRLRRDGVDGSTSRTPLWMSLLAPQGRRRCPLVHKSLCLHVCAAPECHCRVPPQSLRRLRQRALRCTVQRLLRSHVGRRPSWRPPRSCMRSPVAPLGGSAPPLQGGGTQHQAEALRRIYRRSGPRSQVMRTASPRHEMSLLGWSFLGDGFACKERATLHLPTQFRLGRGIALAALKVMAVIAGAPFLVSSQLRPQHSFRERHHLPHAQRTL